MFTKLYPNFKVLMDNLERGILSYNVIQVSKKWQGQENPPDAFAEIMGLSFGFPLLTTIEDMQEQIKPNLPWAEEHFMERIHGDPVNPGITYKKWPYYRNIEEKGHRSENEKFTHTYMERYWPKFANKEGLHKQPHHGIRYDYGDLADVISLLYSDKSTRQAYLPIWFPEDTGVVHGGRVPCSIGYHFYVRHNSLYVHYMLRSCDIVRHFRDDMYLTNRLAFFIASKLGVVPGVLSVNISSLHCFESDLKIIGRGK